jgi:two-component system sensor histidine kinase YesM
MNVPAGLQFGGKLRSLFNKKKDGGKVHSIASRHIRMFLLFIALPVLLILILSGVFFRRHIIEIAENQWELTLRRYAAAIEVDLQSMSITASSLVHNTTLMERSLEYINSKSAEQRYLVSLEIGKLFNTYFLLSRQLVGFHLYFPDDHIPLVFRNYSGIDLSHGETERAIDAADSRRGFVVFPDSLAFNYGQQINWYTISLAVSPPDKIYTTGVRTVIVSFVVNSLMDFIRAERPGTGDAPSKGIFGTKPPAGQREAGRDVSDSLVLGRDGTVIASSNPEMLGVRREDIEHIYGKSCILISAPVDLTDWIIMEAVNINSLTRSINIILYILYFAALVIVLFFIRYNTFFFSLILNPLRALMTKMEAVGNGDFSVRAPPGNFTELNKIGESFNFMVEEIGALTRAIKAEQKERLRSEIEALRCQLNPHFLCNTLNAIRMMAIITKNDAIREMSSALMRLTEDTLSREDTVYSLEHELHNLDNYVYIMKVRYGDTFEFIKDVDASLLRLGVPSMILQPLVENAILHGFHGLAGGTSFAGDASGRGQNVIVVSASAAEGVLTIEVKDNGRGMSTEVLAGIFDNEPGTQNGWSRIGLKNVRRRIMLTYGNSYAVRLESYPGEGTVVIMTLPVQDADNDERAGNTGREDLQHDEYADHR